MHEKESRIPEFLEALDEMRETHIRKNQDYATADNPFSNFDVSAYIGSLFINDRDKAFAILIGIKLGRLASLLNSGNKPNNESIRDTFLDASVYMLLWMADVMRRKVSPSTKEGKCDYCGGRLLLSSPHTVSANGKFCSIEHWTAFCANSIKEPI